MPPGRGIAVRKSYNARLKSEARRRDMKKVLVAFSAVLALACDTALS